jgi:hypothetical protein
MKITIIAAMLAATSLTACNYVPFTPANRIQSAKDKIAILSANPTTIQWSDVKEHHGEVCGIFNAQEPGYPVRSELVWSGPQPFITIKGQPSVVGQESDCDTVVAAFARCFNDGDPAKITEAVTACKAQNEAMAEQYAEEVADRMRSTGIVATGDPEVDQRTWDAYYKAGRFEGMSLGADSTDRVRFNAGKRFIAVYNAEMRKLPQTATKAQRVAANPAAEREATRQAEVILEAGGVV